MEMFRNLYKGNRLKNVNPIIQIAILVLVTVTVSLDKLPFLSVVLFLLSGFAAGWLSDIGICPYLWKLRYVFGVAMMYTLFILLGQKSAGKEWDLLYAIALGFRFVLIAGYSMLFVKTVHPKELVMSIIKYFRIPSAYGFAFLSAYRFFPTFAEQLEQIKFSHATRGLVAQGIFAPIKNFMSYTIPLLVTSIRNGTRIAIAMQARGFGKYDNRNAYEEIYLKKSDFIFLGVFLSIFIVVVVFLNHYHLMKPSWVH